MDRSPLYLAAIASAAVPGLDPVTVEALPSLPEDRFDVAFVRDTEHRRWVVRAPRTEAAGAAMDASTALLGLLARRVAFSVPSPKGMLALKGGGRAAVYPYLPGDSIDFGELPDGPGLAADLGRVLAGIHNLDPALVDEAGMPAYDADAYRARRLSDLDRAAATGRVPTALLARWEHALEDVSLWRFAATPVHGNLTGDQVLVVFDAEDAGSGRVRGVIGWEHAKVADPADDFAALVDQAEAEVVDRVLEAYAHARVERPDANLLVRARLAAELGLLSDLMEAVARKDDAAVEGYTSRLRRLDEHVHSLEESTNDYQRMSLTPAGQRQHVVAPPAELTEDTDSDEDLTPLEPSVRTRDRATDETTEIEVTSVGHEPALDSDSDSDSDRIVDQHEAEVASEVEPTNDADAETTTEAEAETESESESDGKDVQASRRGAETVEIRLTDRS